MPFAQNLCLWFLRLHTSSMRRKCSIYHVPLSTLVHSERSRGLTGPDDLTTSLRAAAVLMQRLCLHQFPTALGSVSTCLSRRHGLLAARGSDPLQSLQMTFAACWLETLAGSHTVAPAPTATPGQVNKDQPGIQENGPVTLLAGTIPAPERLQARRPPRTAPRFGMF